MRETLTELVILADRLDGLYVVFQGSWSGITKFNLKRLTVPFAFLMGSHDLDMIRRLGEYSPPTIEEVTITDGLHDEEQHQWNDEAHVNLLEAWFATSNRFTPRLRKLRFSGAWYELWLDPELKELYDTVRIFFRD